MLRNLRRKWSILPRLEFIWDGDVKTIEGRYGTVGAGSIDVHHVFFKDYRGSTPALWYLCLAEEAFRPCLRCCCLVKDSHWMWLHHTLFPASLVEYHGRERV